MNNPSIEKNQTRSIPHDYILTYRLIIKYKLRVRDE